ncbi:type II toxin-antitoxin system death-on-curing family toxin [Streptomyces sp. cmx-4-9]|uniref:type II toxin-antitoxin system death-on-curing family toxin n=1 Tax=Streptomyces sp. cmx-4-9 TaxID=2790941 RepID=UPI00397F8DAB
MPDMPALPGPAWPGTPARPGTPAWHACPARHACLARHSRGSFGIRLPQAAVHRPRSGMFGTAACGDPYAQAAALLHGIAVNHPLVDGDKRTAWPAAATFLAVNGIGLADADQEAAYALVIDVAAGREADVAAVAGRLRAM